MSDANKSESNSSESGEAETPETRENVMWWNETRPIDNTLIAGDIARMFECTPRVATAFLHCYGCKVGGRYGIGRYKLIELINSGEAELFFKSRRGSNG